MAQVTQQPGALSRWSSSQTRAQFAAITSLRMRIFRNGLRRKGGSGDLVATIIMVPIFAIMTIGPTVAAGFGAWYLVSQGELRFISLILWAIFGLCQIVNINLGQPGTTFDPTQLIRFPLNFRGYAAIRVFFGLISPSNAVGTMMSFAVAVGVTVADPGLGPYAFATVAAFALMNIFFTRMLFSWIDRWLSTRRAREIFTGLIFAFSFGVQYINFTFNPGFQHGRHAAAITAARIATVTGYYHRAQPVLAALPPGLSANALIAAHNGHLTTFAANLLGVVLFAVLFFAVFAVRLYKEFRGENLSNTANAVAKTPAKKATNAAAAPLAPPSSLRFTTPPTIAAVFGKEVLTMRRNSGVFYAVLAPLVMVIFFVSRLSWKTPPYILFPAAVAYTLMGIAPICYNSLGLEAAGIQFYFLAPVRMRDVFLAKNLMSFGLAAIEILAVLITIILAAKAPSPPMLASVLLWAAFTMFLSVAVGNRRSVTAPKKIDPAKMSNKQASPLSALLSIGLLLACTAVGAGTMVGARFLNMPWLLPPIALGLAIAGFFVYQRSLASMDKLLADHRDELSEALCKTT